MTTCRLIKQGDLRILCCAASFAVMCSTDNDVMMGILTHPLPMVRKKTNDSILRWLTPVAITAMAASLGTRWQQDCSIGDVVCDVSP